MASSESDLERLKTEYKNRYIRLQERNVYSSLNIAHLFMIQQRQRAAVDLLHKAGVRSLAQMHILEVGCGQGDGLQELTFHRTAAQQMYGAELLSDRLIIARRRFPGMNLVIADGQNLPYASGQFDLVFQYTVFSSILDDRVKSNISKEMLRVVKLGGLIVWYDFWLNPTNPQTKGIRKMEIKRLFPNCEFTFRRITLAPPISRMLVPFSWGLSVLLEKLTFLNTHYLVAIQPK